MAPMTTSDSNKLSPGFWKAASAGLVVAAVLVSGLTGSFYGTGLPWLVEALVGALAGALCFWLFMVAARLLARILSIPLSEFMSFVVAAIGVAIVLRSTRFRWNPMLFYPAAIVFFAAQATLFGALWGWFKTEGRRGLYGALVVVALAVDIAGFAWLANDGSDPYPVAEVENPSPSPPVLDMRNPAEPGTFDVETLTYGSGTDIRRPEFGPDVTIATATVDASKLLPEWKDFKARARKWYWGFSLEEAPLNARVWMPRGDGPFPLALIVHGNHRMEDHSDPGYAYLGELLASQGIIMASVDENYINGTWSGDFRGKEMQLRGWLLLEHLRLWHEWNETPGHRFEGRIDVEKIALMGHSRGGEAVAIAHAFNQLPFYPDDATVHFDYGFNIRSLVAIAQIDQRYPRRMKLENVNFLALQGSYDADEPSFHGLRQFRRLTFTDDDYWFKAGIYIHRANHGQFNSSWGRFDSSFPGRWLLNTGPLISGEDQREIAKVYISAFLLATLREVLDYLPLFRDPRVASKWLPNDIVYVQQFDDSTFSAVADYEEDIDVTTASREGAFIETDGLTLWREEELLGRDKLTQSTNVAVLGWNESGASYAVTLGDDTLELDDSMALSFFLSSSTEKPDDDEDAESVPLELSVELTDAHGAVASVRLLDIAPITPPIKVQYLKIEWFNRAAYNSTWEPILQSYWLPLSRFDGVDSKALVSILFRFNSNRGVVLLDEIGFRGVPMRVEPSAGEGDSEAQTRESGDRPAQ